MISAGDLTLSFDARIYQNTKRFYDAQGLGLKQKRLPLYWTISFIADGPLLLPLCPIRFPIWMMSLFSKSLLRVRLHALLREIKNISLLNDAKA